MKVAVRDDRTHNPCGEAHGVSGLRENLTSRSDGEGLETGPRDRLRHRHKAKAAGNSYSLNLPLPRQSFTRQRSQGWMARFRRLARDYEQLAQTLKGLHVVAFTMLMLRRLTALILQSA